MDGWRRIEIDIFDRDRYRYRGRRIDEDIDSYKERGREVC